MQLIEYICVENDVDGSTLMKLVADLNEFVMIVPHLKDRLNVKQALKVCTIDLIPCVIVRY